VRPHADLLHSKGVGVIGVEEDGATAWRSPPSAESTAEVTDIEGQLSLRLRGNEFGGDITTLSLAQPLNYFAPVVALDRYGPRARRTRRRDRRRVQLRGRRRDHRERARSRTTLCGIAARTNRTGRISRDGPPRLRDRGTRRPASNERGRGPAHRRRGPPAARGPPPELVRQAPRVRSATRRSGRRGRVSTSSISSSGWFASTRTSS